MVGDGVSMNDVAVRTVCKELDPTQQSSRNKFASCTFPFVNVSAIPAHYHSSRCIDHSMHRAAYHFIKALGISSLTRNRQRRKQGAEDDEEVDEEEEDEADVDVSMDIEASADDAEAMADTLVVEFELGDTLGKLLAFVNQVRMSSEGIHEYLAECCRLQGIKPIEILLWVRSRWGSLSHCFGTVLAVQKVNLLSPLLSTY